MHLWTITAFDATTPLAEGLNRDTAQAWRDAITAALDQFTATELDGCVIAMDGTHAWLMPERAADGEVDVPITRAAAERVAIASIGGLFTGPSSSSEH